MSKRRGHKKIRVKPSDSVKSEVVTLDGQQQRREEWFIVLLLLAFGMYQSILYYQHQLVPSSDFPAFSGTAEPLFHFELPSSFKRVPMLGFLHILAGKLCGGAHPQLTAAWILNGIFHALSIVLFYRVGRHLLGRNAFYFAVLAGCNPWILQMTADPIAETTMIFMTLLTYDFMLRRSRWCYLFAMMASMTRYELTALIAIAFAVDMLLGKDRKDRIKACGWAFLASLPMIAWVICWRVYRPAGSHYTEQFIGTQTRAGLDYWKWLRRTALGPLLQVPSWVAATFGKIKITSQQQADAIKQAAINIEALTWGLAGIGCACAIVFAAIKKNWRFWALFAFWAIYVGAHTMRHRTLDRYTIPAIWLTLLIVFYGLQSLVGLLREKIPAWRYISFAGQIVILMVASIWLVRLAGVLPATVELSKRSTSLVYVSLAVVVIFLAGSAWIRKYRLSAVLSSMTVLAMCGLLLVSNQFQVVRILGNGGKDAEFKMLAEWYLDHAEPGEKMTTSMATTVRLFVPDYKQNITRHAAGKTFPEFIQNCYQNHITYVVWDSRLGLCPNDHYYKAWNLQKVAPLAQPKDIGPFQFVGRITQTPRRYLHIFKLRPLSSLPPTVQEQLKPKPPEPKQP